MCGRYVSVAAKAELVELYDATAPDLDVAPASYNVAPTQQPPPCSRMMSAGELGATHHSAEADAHGARFLRLPRWPIHGGAVISRLPPL